MQTYTPFQNTSYGLSQLKSEIEQEEYEINYTCKYCKTTLQDFLDTGFVGCARCYDLFNKQAREFALDIHGRANHVGKFPSREVTKQSLRREIERLIKEKEKAVREENYLVAEQLKSKIEQLREAIR